MILDHLKKYFYGKALWVSLIVGVLGLVWIALLMHPVPYKILGAGIWLVLVYAAVIDFRTQLVSDAVSLVIAVLGVIYCVVAWQSPWHWGLGIVINAMVMFALYAMSKKSMGMGDVKLMIALGIFMGPMKSFYVLFYASVVGAIVAIIGLILKKVALKQEVPFIPYIALGVLLALSAM